MSRRARVIGVAIGLTIVVLATLPPFVGSTVRGVLMDAFAGVCHQLPDRSAHIGGVPLAVCHRCYGIYLGLLVAPVVYPVLSNLLKPFETRAPLVLIGSLVPLSLDWLLDAVSLVNNVPLSRAVTGWIFGLAAGYYLVKAFDELARPGAVRNTVGQSGESGEIRSASP